MELYNIFEYKKSVSVEYFSNVLSAYTKNISYKILLLHMVNTNK